MPARFRTKDRVLETSVTTGAGTYTLAGAATGFQTFVGGDVAASDLVPYFAEDGTNWEVGIGEVLSGPARLVRTTVLKSSNANAAVNWGAGTKNLRCGWPAELNTPRVKSVSIAGGAGSQVLTQDEQRCDVLILTGAITGNRVIEVDTAPWCWVVFNNTTGAFTVTLKVNGQTGVAITQTKSKVLYCDGTDVEDANTDIPSSGAASESASGIAEIATQAEVDAGSDDLRFVTPLKLKTTTALTTIATEQASTSGTSLDFTGIPAGTKEIDIHPVGVSLSGSAQLLIQIGDAGGIENTSYIAVAATNGGGTSSTAGFIASHGSISSSIHSGRITLKLEDSSDFTWTASGNVSRADGPTTQACAGSKSLSQELDRVRITTTNGTDTFDAGVVNISYRK